MLLLCFVLDLLKGVRCSVILLVSDPYGCDFHAYYPYGEIFCESFYITIVRRA